jgi:hypothetical protein
MQMRVKHLVAGAVSAVIFLGTGAEVRANLALSLNPNATISTLSAQLLKKPRSQAGNKVNVWDCDPPGGALAGMHYFAYNIGADLLPLAPADRAITLRSFESGPGYTAVAQAGVTNGGERFFLNADAQGNFDFTGLTELGIARVSFVATGAPTGQIDPGSDGDEMDYDAKDINGVHTETRGVEHVRFTTENLDDDPVTDNAIVRGLVSATMPDGFGGFTNFNLLGGAPSTDGYLDFGSGFVSTGLQVFPAFVQTPEPASLAALAVAGTLLKRRRRA